MLKRAAKAAGIGSASVIENRMSPWIAGARVFVGLLLLYELFVGGWWKLGAPQLAWPPIEPNPGWIGPDAGAVLSEAAAGRAIEEGTFTWFAALLETVVLPYADFWSIVAVLTQLLVGVAFVIGLWTRPAAIAGLLYFVPVFHFGTIRTSPLFGVPIAFLLIARAGHHYGLDGAISARTGQWARLSDQFATLSGLPRLPRRALPAIVAALSTAVVYYLLSITRRDVTRQALVGLELAVMLGLVALGTALYYRGGEAVGIAADMVRIFVGYRFIHEIFVRTHAGVNGLPGWASLSDQAELFSETIAASHVGPMATFIEVAVLPVLPAWALAFAVVQTVVGIALLVGYRTRLAGAVATAYLVTLIALGFVRLAPLLFSSALIAATLAGQYMSLDAVAGRNVQPPEPSETAFAPAALGSVALFIAGASIGIDPEMGYGEVVGPVALVMLSFVLAVVALAAAAGRRSGKLAPTSEGVPTANQ